MNMKKTILCIGLLTLLAGCKPTEKGYRQAYDAALAKRQQQIENSLPVEGLISDEAPRQIAVGEKKYRVSDEGIRVEGSEKMQRGVYVAVSAFKMPTNARAEAEALRKEGYDANAARTISDRWYVVAACFDNVDAAAKFIDEFARKHPRWAYIGLEGEPLIIRNSL